MINLIADPDAATLARWANETYHYARIRLIALEDDIAGAKNPGRYKTLCVLEEQWENIAKLAADLESALDSLEDMKE